MAVADVGVPPCCIPVLAAGMAQIDHAEPLWTPPWVTFWAPVCKLVHQVDTRSVSPGYRIRLGFQRASGATPGPASRLQFLEIDTSVYLFSVQAVYLVPVLHELT